MFEQSEQSYQYSYEPAPEPLKEGDPFYRYEIKNWELGPRIYKILGISAILNIVALVVAVQGSLLTMKGCDSPLVGTMCQVLDTVYVGSMLFGTDREYVDVAYDKTDLGDVDITYVDVTGLENQKLFYPANYWEIANPEKYTIDPETGEMIAAMPQTLDTPGYIAPGIPYTPPSTGGNSLFDTQPNFPQSNPNPVEGNLPQSGGSGVGSNPIGRNRKGRGGRITPATDPNPTGTPDPNTVAEAKPSPSPSVEPAPPVDPNAYNSRPLVDLAQQVNVLMAQNKYRLDSPFLISARGKLGKDGKFEKGKGGFLVNEKQSQFPDEATKNVILAAIAAMNDSGRLKVLTDLSGKDFNLILMQDGTNLNAVIETEMENDMRANSVKSSFDLAIALAKQAKSGAGADQNDKDDLQLLQNVQVETSGKKVTIRYIAPKDLFLPMIQRKLDEEKAKASQPNGNSGTKPTDNTAKK